MMAGPEARRFADGRLHLQHGPIDLIIEAFGEFFEVELACLAATTRFASVLDELCAELSLLRLPAHERSAFQGDLGNRMADAVRPYAAESFITPMAAVAGAVAEEILAAMLAAASLSRAYVNNGGDIAFHLAAGERFSVGLIDRPDRPSLFARTMIGSNDGIGGIATSGRHGRSFSLGIADAVTVLAAGAAEADAAATIIANAVDLPGHPAVQRAPASDIDPQSDLGGRLVTVGLGALSPAEIEDALEAGLDVAETLFSRGLVVAAALHLCGQTMTTHHHALIAQPMIPQPMILQPLILPAIASMMPVKAAERRTDAGG